MRLSGCLLVGALLLGGHVRGQESLSEIQGTWRETSRIRDGAPMTAGLATMTQDVDGKMTTAIGGSVVYQGTANVGTAGTQKIIDYVQTAPDEGKGEIRKGIYELSGDTLRICLARPGAPRPTEFVATAGSGFVLSVYIRAKP